MVNMIKSRIEKIQRNLDSAQALLVTSGPNRFYLTGFESSAGAVFITPEKAEILIDFRYVEKAKNTVSSCAVTLSSNLDEELNARCKKENIKELFVEAQFMSVARRKTLTEKLAPTTVSDDDRFDKLIEDMRCVKTAEELALIKRSQELTDKTFSYILNNIKAGRTEREVMLDMEFYMRKLGSEGVSFDFIVVSGKNSSLPHGVPTDKKIENGDFITMDFGAAIGGYRADMTRTVAVGHVTDEMQKVYDTVLKAQLEALKVIKAGVVCNSVDKVARDIIYSAGYEGCFGHGLGHSVGIEIHENPAFNTRCTTVLKPGTVMTVEPGIYLENRFGVRIEDMVYVRENDCLNLTESEKQLIIL